MDSLVVRQRFEEQTESLTEFYGCEPELIVHDLHPDYYTTRWAEEQPLPKMGVQHHQAHIAGGMLEQGWLDRTVLGVAYDGTGYGTDGTIWGGEFLITSATSFERVAHLRPFQLPGGEVAVRRPWRVALSIFQDALGSDKALELLNPMIDGRPATQLARLLERGRAGVVTTSAGRLFDGVAAVLLSVPEATYEGELAIRLEAISQEAATGRYAFPLTRYGGMISLDWRPMLVQIAEEFTRGIPCGEIAMRFHRSLAEGISQIVRQFADLPVVFSGGCFQNRLLTELIQDTLADHPQPLGWPGVIPPNDGGLAAGQLAIAAARLAEQRSKRSDLSCA
jgi:hydrogenase maturation protein HypF